MITVVWAPSFRRAYKLHTRTRPELHEKIMATLQLLMKDTRDPILRIHKLHGRLEGLLACSVEYDLRIVFDIMENPKTNQEELLLIDIGTHEEVY